MNEAGAVTVEAAIAIASITVVVVLCLGSFLAVSAHVRCVDAAREAARLVARGDRAEAVLAAQRVAPRGARITVREVDGFATAVVEAAVPLLPALDISAEAVAAMEDSGVAEASVVASPPPAATGAGR
ncbi:TadE family type IV pilus minor pilin [Rhodococcus sp. UNC363MFTsu5.1]|uniref:TadE family type IV pilus minor pilin n=1 Tax=Rhodococcus sp. UNC363MFTsu5.1 TaxID=1449069 RepID=UPI00068C9100|nr:TadE family type IV pilus minor pilin [Rhodococcus sp. UNC363MFTsu5.1]